MVFGLGMMAWAGPLSGTWDATFTLDPSETTFADYIVLASGLTVDYAIGGWVFGSVSGFSSDGWDAQSFSAEGALGAFTFTGAMNFLPYALVSSSETVGYANGTLYFDNGLSNFILTPLLGWFAINDFLPVALVNRAGLVAEAIVVETETYGVAFDDLTLTAEVSIAGVSFAAEFFMEHWAGATTTTTEPVYFYEVGLPTPTIPWLGDNTIVPATEFMVQSGSSVVVTPGDTVTGAGWLFTVAGSFGDVTLTSFTLFNLAPDLVAIDDGDVEVEGVSSGYVIDVEDQVVRFSHEFVVLEGLSLGCVELDAYLWISCLNGYEALALSFTEIPVILGINTDFLIRYELQQKVVELTPSLDGEWLCWTPTIALIWDDVSVISGITISAMEVELALNGVTFSSKTTFGSFMDTIDSGNTTDYYFTLPKVDTTDTTIPVPCIDTIGDGYYVIDKVEIANDYYKTFEYFKIEIDGDSCCGGLFDATIQTWFGQHYTADLGEYGYWYENNINGLVGGTAAAYGQGFYFINGATAATTFTYMYDELNIWYPGCGWIPLDVIDVAYSELIGLDGTPVVYTVSTPPVAADIVETVTGAGNYTTVETAASNRLFEWAKTSVDASIGIGANITLTLGLAIDGYGWDSFDIGFDWSF